ncbi:deSI-like protein [Iris pallida]|uniref:DeSI-like protein n=1 Tax=Iris pallida TaxID=29817 RepID=A0AAX6HDD4_IRIPA|nr:deSI-like protein [Iris pallida]
MPSFLSGSPSSSDDANGGSSGGSRTPVYLNVYDLTPINDSLYVFGLGIFHSGIEVHGVEYGFGAHEYPASGIFEVEPKSCPGFIFRCSVWLGTTDMSRTDFRLFIEQLAGNYHGDTYHLIAKNCNHFTNDVCTQLTGKSIPGWVNRLAKLGSFCNCLLPENIQVAAVRHLPEHLELSDGSESLASLSSSDEEEPHKHLLKASSSEPSISMDKPIRLAKDLL